MKNSRKILMALLALLLIAVVAVTMVACSKEEAGGEQKLEKKDPVSQYKAKDEWPEVKDPLSWENINSYPIKTSNMSIDDARQLCVDFFRYSKTAVWIPDDNFTYFHNSEMTNEFTQIGGQLYGGLPYIAVSSGNIYRIMDFMDEEKGVVDVSELTINPKLYGNQCSIGSWWGWARCINSFEEYDWTQTMVESQGYIRVGDYEYELATPAWSDGYRTTTIVEENGRDKMFECYAQLKKGDGIVYFTTAGHVVMIATDAVVVHDVHGKIDGALSYVTVIDQTPGWAEGSNEAGDNYQYEKNVDAKWNFNTLFERYVPFTYKEWLGEDPIEQTELTLSIGATQIKGVITEDEAREFKSEDAAPDTISKTQLFNTKVTCNYGLSDIYCMVYDAAGNEVFKTVTRAGMAGRMELKFSKTPGNSYTWGSLEELDKSGTYTAKIYIQLGTGERPVVWEGPFTLN